MRRRKKRSVVIEESTYIPVPPRPSQGRPAMYPWKTLATGGSFFVEGAEPFTVKSNVASANRRYAPKHFVYRSEEHGVRVWRDK